MAIKAKGGALLADTNKPLRSASEDLKALDRMNLKELQTKFLLLYGVESHSKPSADPPEPHNVFGSPRRALRMPTKDPKPSCRKETLQGGLRNPRLVRPNPGLRKEAMGNLGRFDWDACSM